jgi:phosphohistidine phosphatase
MGDSGAKRTLWVLRHAKAEPHRPEDHGRRLAARGRRQCAEVAEHLAGLAKGRPKLVLSSSATRALETAEGVVDALGRKARIVVEPKLYRADADDVLDVVREVDDAHDAVMVVGHNPTLLDLVELLLDSSDAAGRAQLSHGLPTAALAVVASDAGRWAELSFGAGRLRSLYVPKAR